MLFQPSFKLNLVEEASSSPLSSWSAAPFLGMAFNALLVALTTFVIRWRHRGQVRVGSLAAQELQVCMCPHGRQTASRGLSRHTTQAAGPVLGSEEDTSASEAPRIWMAMLIS